MTNMMKKMQLAALLAATPLIIAPLATPLMAQTAPRAQLASNSRVDARWDAWVGCWQAEAAPLPGEDAQARGTPLEPVVPGAPTVCVVPTSDPSTVQIVTVSRDSVLGRDTIAATGQQVARTRQGCTGWDDATWSSDGQRVYVRSQDSCSHELARTSTGVLAMSPNGEWVDVHGVAVGGHTGVRAVRYRSVPIPAALPSDLAAALITQTRDRALALSAARSAAGAPLTDAAIADASHHLDPSVAEAWILASGQHVNVDANHLVALANAGVPGKVTDALVALSYPKEFALSDAAAAAGGSGAISLQNGPIPASAYNGVVTGREIPVFMDPYSYLPYYGYYSGYYSPYSYYGYGYGAPYGYGLSPYGYLAPYGGYIAPPIIVLKGSSSPGVVPGRAIKGHGYQPSSPVTGSRTAQPRNDSPPPSGSTQTAPPPASPPPQRTAHPRP